ncbi:MAG: hypothetical protein AB1Z67_09275 [Candidatus Limnocylindrales bacterium]
MRVVNPTARADTAGLAHHSPMHSLGPGLETEAARLYDHEVIA